MIRRLIILLLIVGCDQISKPDIPKLLQTISKELNSKLPMEIDQWHTMTSTSSDKNTLTYAYWVDIKSLLDHYSRGKDAYGKDDWIKDIYNQGLNGYCTDPDLAVYRKYNAGLEWEYYDLSGTILHSHRVDKNDCP